jgi:glycosyl transferase, family 25
VAGHNKWSRTSEWDSSGPTLRPRQETARLDVGGVFIVHMRENNELRRDLVTREMKAHGIDSEFMLEGDVGDLHAGNMADWFTDEVVRAGPGPGQSCAFKHLRVYEEMVERGIGSALIFEDDIALRHDFVEAFNATVAEAKARPDIDWDRVFVSYENSGLRYVPVDARVPGRRLYRMGNTRCAGAYLVTLPVARRILEYTRAHKLDCPIDWHHRHIVEAGLMDVYWCHPTVAEQRSHSGVLPSLIDEKPAGPVRRLSWAVQRFFREHVRSRLR